MNDYRYDKHLKVEDSTKGKANVNPKKYKGDVYTQAWMDARKLATLSIWLDDAGYRTRFLSEVVKFTIDMVLEHLIDSGNVKMIEFTEEARDILEAKYRTNLNPGGRGKRNVLHNMVLDDRRKGMRTEEYRADSRFTHNFEDRENLSVQTKDESIVSERPENNRAINNVSKEDLDKMVEIMKEKEHEDRVKSSKEALEKVKANATYGEDIGNGERVIIVKPVKGNPDEKDMEEYKEREKKREKDEELDKKDKRLERREEKLLNKQDELNEEENKDE